ncbi:MAG TPA: hypothetical protein VG317_12460, partial [Pseudonocardiaceae bacterium]|nr:hypothetical protein [Pseudonocardiaceae bacterium]
MTAIVVVAPVFLLAAGCTALLIEDTGTASPSARGEGSDGLWMGHAWVDGQHSTAELNVLIGRIQTAGIRDLFVHVGPLADNGALDPRLRPDARQLTNALHRALPAVRVQAWLGGVVGSGRLNLAETSTRTNIVIAAQQVLGDGFDGIHYDLEPVPDGDPRLLALLDATRPITTAAHAILSVAADQTEPLPDMATPAQWIVGHPHFWSTGYLHAVASTVDEVAIMAYDSGIP